MYSLRIHIVHDEWCRFFVNSYWGQDILYALRRKERQIPISEPAVLGLFKAILLENISQLINLRLQIFDFIDADTT